MSKRMHIAAEILNTANDISWNSVSELEKYKNLMKEV
jgi:hypothetical protein